MKGIAFHWEDPWKDIYTGIDPHASAWAMLGKTFGYQMVAIQCGWPVPTCCGMDGVRSFEDFLKTVPGETVVLADYAEPGTPNPNLKEIDWLVFGPASGWRGTHVTIPRWCYRPYPSGGFHAIHLAHIAAHVAGGDVGNSYR